MVRLTVTQVVWKNSEDEILKAAVMKYGLNQWGRVASLFAKRSAKACKARWDEWLDPRIKKTEWAREEDEKLLHLAKLMPTQWRTIAPLVGRTASQCLERYERLLDAVDDEGEGEEEGGSTKRKQIQAPETLPAKPDAVDLEDEETEMLSEARARLANTLGKKAKRKARERQLEAQQRQTMVQKRREMKAAGISGGMVSHSKRKRKNSDPEQIDFTTEVPFELLAPKGPHDTSLENLESQRRERDERSRIANLEKISEAKRRAQIKQTNKVKKTSAKDLELKLESERQRNEDALRVARGARAAAFSLPAPQVSDSELEDVAKVSSSITGGGAFAPPAMPRGRNLETEAKAQLARSRGEALFVDKQQAEDTGSVISSALPSLASRRTFSGTNGRVVLLRDELGINRTSTHDVVASASGGDVLEDAEQLAKASSLGLQDSLRNLPEPEYEYSVQVKRVKQTGEDEDGLEGDAARVPDAREIETKRQRLVEEKNRLASQALPTAVKLGLPDVAPLKQAGAAAARDLIWNEMQRGLRKGDSSSVPADALPELVEIRQLAEREVGKLTLQQLDNIFAPSISPLSHELAVVARTKLEQVAKQCQALELALGGEPDTNQLRDKGLFKALHALKRQSHNHALYTHMKLVEDKVGEERVAESLALLAQVRAEEQHLQELWSASYI
ncbi:hypothetical protein BASA81_001867 [Batrachochytrium salamandrivorans]|nr:hypothetical protein BASA81_001867 [Batrachochytrium salamandrivorans]